MLDGGKTYFRITVILAVVLVIVYIGITFQQAWAPSGAKRFSNISLSVPAGGAGRNFPERKWLHQVNSVERIRYADSRYTGIEIDVVFDEKNYYFDVRHYPTPSSGLTLDKLIEAITTPKNHFYWIDFKNLTDDNKMASARELLRIASKYNILANIIVESGNPGCLKQFSQLGFYTSYYLPNINPYKISTRDLDAHIKMIASNLAMSPLNAISADEIQYELIKKYFDGYDILLWNFTDNPLALKLREYRLLKDPKVKVLLIDG